MGMCLIKHAIFISLLILAGVMLPVWEIAYTLRINLLVLRKYLFQVHQFETNSIIA